MMEAISDPTGQTLLLDDADVLVHTRISGDGDENVPSQTIDDEADVGESDHPMDTSSGVDTSRNPGTSCGAGVDGVLENLSILESGDEGDTDASSAAAAAVAASGSVSSAGDNATRSSIVPGPLTPASIMGGLFSFGRGGGGSSSNASSKSTGKGESDSQSAAAGSLKSGATGTSASNRSTRSNKSQSSVRSTTTILTRRAVKKCPNGDLFSGLCDAVTGEPVEGRLTDAKTGEIYEGPFVRGRRHGESGHSVRLDGSKFFGSFRNGDPYEGTLITEQFTYQGRLLIPQPASRAYIFHGPRGTLLHRNGDIFQGGFSLGRYHGKGRERSSSGLNYTGHFKSGKWHGIGDLIVERRSTYSKGSLKDKKKVQVAGAPSVPFNPDAFRYTYYGEWQHGEREGNGYEKIVFGKSLTGQQPPVATPPSHRSTSSSDQGSTTSADERLKRRTAIYEGEFHRDRRHGTGVLIIPDGTELRGFWREGVPSVESEEGEEAEEEHRSHLHRHRKKGHRHKSSLKKRVVFSTAFWEIDYANGDRYRGEVALTPVPLPSGSSRADGMKNHLHINVSMIAPVIPHGKGTMIYGSSGDVYKGSFHLGKRHGFGRCISQMNGEEFDGTWIEDLPGEVGGVRTNLSQPHFDDNSTTTLDEKVRKRLTESQAAVMASEDEEMKEEQIDGEAMEIDEPAQHAEPVLEDAKENASKTKDVPSAKTETIESPPPPVTGLLSIFGIRRGSQIIESGSDYDKEKQQQKSHDDNKSHASHDPSTKSQKSHDDKSVGLQSAGSDKTQTIMNGVRSIKPALLNEEPDKDCLGPVEDSPVCADERTLSTDGLSITSS